MKQHFLLLLAAILMPLNGLGSEELPPVKLEPLCLTVSKFERNSFGKGINPFQFVGESVSGLEILVRVTPDESFAAIPVEDACKLIRFHDDQGTDFLDFDEEDYDSFWKNNRPFSLMFRNAYTGFGLELRSPFAPAEKASQIVVEGILAFAPAAEELAAEHGDVQLESDMRIRVGPVRLRFSRRADAFAHEPHSRTNTSPSRSLPGPPTATGWLVQVLPDEEASNVTLLLYGDDEDVPILNLADSQPGPYRARRGKGTDEDAFSGVTLRGFSCPNAQLSRIKVRYTPSEKMVQVPFKLKTGLGLAADSED